MSRLSHRLKHVETHLGVCPTHLERPICPACDVEREQLSDADQTELNGYLTRLGLDQAPPVSQSPCPRCGRDRLCLACDGARFEVTSVAPLSLTEQGRLGDLLGHLHCRIRWSFP
jgi:hypothetical protein